MASKRITTKESITNTICFTVRFSPEIHEFLRVSAFEQKRSMNYIVEECVKKYKKRFESRLTSDDTVVS